MNRKEKLLTTSLLLVAFSVLGVSMVGISAVPTSPYIMVTPENRVDPTITPGMNYTISVYTDYSGSDIWAWQFSLTFNPCVLEGIEVRNGDLITKVKNLNAVFKPGTFNNTIGTLGLTSAYFYYTSTPITTSGPGTLAYVTFKVKSTGDSYITLRTDTQLRDPIIPIIDAFLQPDQIGHGYFRNTLIAPTHDIAVTSVTQAPTAGDRGMFVTITVIVENQGTVDDIFEVKAYYDYDPAFPGHNVIETKTALILAAGASKTLSFTWNTALVWPGNHTITAVVPSISGETDTADNTLPSGVEVKIIFRGDVNNDGKVDNSDLLAMSKAYGSYPSKSNWNLNCDFNLDGKVDAYDLFDLSKNYGKRV